MTQPPPMNNSQSGNGLSEQDRNLLKAVVPGMYWDRVRIGNSHVTDAQLALIICAARAEGPTPAEPLDREKVASLTAWAEDSIAKIEKPGITRATPADVPMLRDVLAILACLRPPVVNEYKGLAGLADASARPGSTSNRPVGAVEPSKGGR